MRGKLEKIKVQRWELSPAAPPSPFPFVFITRNSTLRVTYCPKTPHAATPSVPPRLPRLRDGLCSFQQLLFPLSGSSSLPLLLPTLFEGAFYESKVPSMGRSKDSNAPGCDFISS